MTILDIDGFAKHTIDALEDEVVVTRKDNALLTIPGNTTTIAQNLNSLLGNPSCWDEVTRSFTKNGVTVEFTHRKSGVNDVWVFKKDKIDDVMTILDIDGFAKHTIASLEDEVVVKSAKSDELLTIPGNTYKNAQKLNALLGNPSLWPELIRTLTRNGVTVDFIHRKNGGSNVWVFKKDKIQDVMKLLGIVGFAKHTIASLEDEVVVSSTKKGLPTIFGITYIIAQRLNTYLGNPSLWPELVRSFTRNGVTVDFIHRKSVNTDVWVFKKDKIQDVMKLLGIKE